MDWEKVWAEVAETPIDELGVTVERMRYSGGVWTVIVNGIEKRSENLREAFALALGESLEVKA